MTETYKNKEKKSGDLFVEGEYGQVRFLYKKDGSMPAKKSLDKLKKQKTTKAKYFAYEAALTLWAKTGRFFKSDKSRKYTKILRLKIRKNYPLRLTFFLETNTICRLISIYKKGNDIHNDAALKCADDLRKEYEEITKK